MISDMYYNTLQMTIQFLGIILKFEGGRFNTQIVDDAMSKQTKPSSELMYNCFCLLERNDSGINVGASKTKIR